MEEKLKKVLHNYCIAGIVASVVVALGILAGYFWAGYCPNSVNTFARWIQLGSGALFLWGVLGLLGWEIRTWGGKSPQEKLDVWIYRILHCLGMFLLFASSAALIFSGN